MTTALATMSWSDQGTSFRTDVLCFVLALAFHAPLLWVRMDAKKASTISGPKERLVSVDLIDEVQKKAAPPPVQVKKENSFMDRLKALVKNEPPPPAPPKKALEPKKLADAPSQIKLQPKLADAPQLDNKLVSKAGFETDNPELVKKRQISLKNLDAGVAPLSAKKVGVIEDRGKAIADKGNFKVSSNEVLKGIGGGSDGTLAGPAAPTIAIRTGKSASVEKFSAAKTAKEGKSGFQGGTVDGLGKENLSLRDRIIARDAAPTQIARTGTGGSIGGSPGGVSGGLATKQDAGRFETGGSSGGGSFSGGTAGRVNAAPKIAAAPPVAQKKQKKDLFTITGPLKDRPIIKRVIPRYPSWAQAQGIEAAVVLEFTVQPNGKVKNNIVVRRTTGYPKLDNTAIEALREWVFQPLGDINREEVGLITFTYTLQ